MFHLRQVEKYMRMCRVLAKKNKDCTEWKIGAVIVNRKGTIIGKGYNRYSGQIKVIERNFNIKGWWTLHAEASAILDAIESKKDMQDAIIYIDGIKNTGGKVFSRPCCKCLELINAVGIAAIVYSEKDAIKIERIGM